ncbi:MAG: hypothetical protein HY752_08780 [Nitrospirae bacterium]|nr:hypothetical protein [Nitrospirota bacterium]
MDAFLIHLDEELINNRKDRYYGQHALLDQRTHKYTPRELAFWINFYGLFYEHIYIPANFLTDSQWTIAVLEKLNYKRNKKDSLICSEESPLRVFWDSERWPDRRFANLVKMDWDGKDSVTNQESKSKAMEIAELCDDIFKVDRIIYNTADFKINLTYSLHRLQNEIFCKDKNAAESSLRTPIQELQGCASTLASNPLPGKRYGRNLLYAMFGYHRHDKPNEQIDLQKQFKKILSPYLSKHKYFCHEFLSGVDRVSNELKAIKTSESLKKDLKILMPPDYYDVFHRPAYDYTMKNLHIEQKDAILLDPEAIIKMTPKQMNIIRKLRQRKDYVTAWKQLENKGQGVSEDDIKNAENMLGNYFKAIGGVLHPFIHTSSRILKVFNWCAPLIGTGVGASIPWILQLILTPAQVQDISRAGSVLGCAVGLGMAKGTSAIIKKIQPKEILNISQVDLSEETKINIIDKSNK